VIGFNLSEGFLMDYLDKWKIIETLGEGGQGKVYRVLKLDVDSNIKSTIINSLRNLTVAISYREIQEENYEKLCDGLFEMFKIHDPSQQGALKALHKLGDARDADLAHKRISREIKVMSENLHPNLIRILDVDPDSTWYVSEFYTNGTLADKREMFKGNFSKTLKAIRPLVEAVATLHKKGYVHRDIKPQNIFLNSNNDLILGDFGLIYFEDDQHTRISRTYENVGTRDWMPPWAMGIRIEEVKATFDVFSLGKLLWSMVSGKPVLQLWYFNRNRFNVERLFPDSRYIRFANPLFEKCIVEEEKDCMPDAGTLLKEIDRIISIIELNADPVNLEIERPCKVCGVGKYELVVNDDLTKTRNFGFNPAGSRRMKIFACSHCGHVQLFSYQDEPPTAWQK